MSSSSRPPGPRGHLLLGHFRPFRRDALGFLTRCAREHGDVAAFRLGHRRIVLLSHPEVIEQVLVADNRRFIKHFIIRLLQPVLGDGLLLSEGDFWLRQRRLMQPAFAPRRIEGYAETMVEHTQRMLARWSDGETRDLHEEMMRLALSIVSKVLLDVDTGENAREVAAAVDLLMDDFGYRLKNAFSWPSWIPTPWNLRVERATRRLGDIVQGIIQQRRTSGEDHGDLLSLLVHARDEDDGQGMTDRQLRDEVMTMFLAGHETTANALTWTWYLLAQHPDAETKLLAELDEVLGGRPPTVEDLPRLDYTARVVQEAMRLYPPAYVIGREAVESCEIGGYRLPVGTTFLMSQWVVHRDARWYEDPETFDPDRWTPESTERLPKYAYFPFGGGPRVCIGNKFAEMEAALILATMASQVSFALAPGQDVHPWPAITLRPVEGLRAVVSQRKKLRRPNSLPS